MDLQETEQLPRTEDSGKENPASGWTSSMSSNGREHKKTADSSPRHGHQRHHASNHLFGHGTAAKYAMPVQQGGGSTRPSEQTAGRFLSERGGDGANDMDGIKHANEKKCRVEVQLPETEMSLGEIQR